MTDTPPQISSTSTSSAGHAKLAGKEVLVTGATGFTGRVLVRRLLQLGATVRAIARDSSDTRELDPAIKWFRGEVYDPDVVTPAVSGTQYIFHVAAAFRQAGIDDREYSRVHVESTQLLAKAAHEQEGFQRFVHVSTMGVHGHVDNPPGNEDSPYKPGDQYQRTKLEGELWFRRYAQESGLEHSVIRPTGIYGPGDRRLLKVFRMATWRFFPILGNGRCYYHLIHVEDLCEALLLAAHHPAARSQVFLAGDREAIQLERVASLIGEVTGRRARVVRIPVGPFFVIGDICEALCKPLRIEPPIYRRRVAFYTKDRWFDTSRIHTVLGFRCAYPNELGIRTTAQWYLQQGWI